MAQYVNPAPIDYRYGGDKLSNFAQKYMTTIADVYRALNELKSPGNITASDPDPYQFKVEDNHLFIRNGDNTEWIKLMDVALWGGFKDNTFGYLRSGDYESRPETASDYDTYWCSDGCVYQWKDGAWHIILSKNITDLDGYEHVLLDSDVAEEQGETGKLLRTNTLGQLETDITGSPGKIAGKTVFAPEVHDNQVLTFNAERDRWEVKARDVIEWDDTSSTGEAEKIVLADENAEIHLDTTGNARKIAQSVIDTHNLTEDDVLAYNATAGTFINKPRNDVNNADLTTTGQANKVVKVHSDGTIHANLTGSATKVGGVTVDTTGIANKDLLAYDSTAQALKPQSLTTVIDSSTTITGEAGKLVKVDPNDGFIHGNVQGYATGITGVPVDMTGLTEDSVLAYDSFTHKLVPRSRGALNDADIAHSEADVGKVVVLNENGMIPFSITGNAAKILNKTVVSAGLEDGQILVYRTATQTWNVENKGTVGAGKSLILRNSGDLIATYDGSDTVNVDLHQVIIDVTEPVVSEAISKAYKDGGSVAFASLPSLTAENRGYIYNVTDAFTTTADFVEGSGVRYAAGTNVVITQATAATYALTEDTTAGEGKTYYSDDQGTEVAPQPNKGADISNAGYYEVVPAHYVLTEDTTAQAGKTYYSDDQGTEVAPQPTEGDDISSAGYYEYVLATYALSTDHYAMAGKTYYRDSSGTTLSPQPAKGDDISAEGYYEFVPATYKYDVQSGVEEATASVAGVAKLYNTTGNNTDGAITQAAASTAISNVAGDVSTLQGSMDTAQSDIAALQNAMTTTYKAKGSVAFANLPSTLDATKIGWVYNVYDDFTTDSRFVEGAGEEYFAGENVCIVEHSPDQYVLTEDTIAVEGKTYFTDNEGTVADPQPAKGENISSAGYYEYIAAHYELTEDTEAVSGKTYYSDDQGTEVSPQPTAGDDISSAGYYEYVTADYVPTSDTIAVAGKTYYADGTGTALAEQPAKGDDISSDGYYEFQPAVYLFDVLTGYIDLSSYPRVASWDSATGTLSLTTL